MVAIWADGFDHYGTGGGASMLESGAYLDAISCSVSTVRPRTGAASLVLSAANNMGPRWGLKGNRPDVGVGYVFWLPRLPTDSTSVILLSLRDNDNVTQMQINLSSSGQLIAYSQGVELGRSIQCVQARAFQHFECFAVAGDPDGSPATPGSIEVRLNMVTRLNLTDVHTSETGYFAQAHIGNRGFANTGLLADWYVDDLVTWDSSGAAVNDFLGDKKVYTQFPASDTALAEWTKSVGTLGFEMIDNVPPLDSIEFLEAPSAGTQSRFGLTDLPGDVVSIAFVGVHSRMAKTDAGAANVSVGLQVGSDLIAAPAWPLTQAPTYYFDAFETNPDTGVAWDPAGFNAAELLIDRTA